MKSWRPHAELLSEDDKTFPQLTRIHVASSVGMASIFKHNYITVTVKIWVIFNTLRTKMISFSSRTLWRSFVIQLAKYDVDILLVVISFSTVKYI